MRLNVLKIKSSFSLSFDDSFSIIKKGVVIKNSFTFGWGDI